MPEWLMQVIALIGAGFSVYAGIKTDIARTREVADGARRSAGEAHRRIDDILMEGKK